MEVELSRLAGSTLRLLACVLFPLGVLVPSCSGTDVAGPPSWSSHETTGMVRLSQRVLLLGDNQVQHLYGKGIRQRSAVADRIAGSAIRPAQLDMFGHQLLLDACSAFGQDELPIIHLGDAANASCVQELRRFFQLMKRCRAQSGQWVMAPGNHDGYMMGSFDRDCLTESWRDACGVGRVLTKARFVYSYLREVWGVSSEALAAVTCADGDPSDGPHAPAKGKITSERGLLREAHWKIDCEKRWTSYVAQLIDLTELAAAQPACGADAAATNGRASVCGIVLDTAQYDHPPKLLPRRLDPGTTGSIGTDQQTVVENWIDNAKANARFVLFGHHPIKDLDEDASAFVRKLALQPRVLGYVSGHTHSGRWYAWEVAGRAEPFVELNVGSILDHPNEYRDLELYQLGSSPPVIAAVSSTNPGRQRPACDGSLLPGPQEYLDYRKVSFYDEKRLQRHLLTTQARAWIHFLQTVGISNEGTQLRLVDDLTKALGGGADREEKLRDSTRQAALAVDADMFDPVRQGSPLLQKQKAYLRCVAYQAARHEAGPTEREIRRRIDCVKELDIHATADPFTQRHETYPLAAVSGGTSEGENVAE